ncbi:hypothetical protein CRG98_021209 [Punica granatum]|uniref:Uncharacterized protein n=1 Tax=Punica granatum TaxID=22663 RepID=A0A2I0JQ71_PUNGR|nr:hypothetical protein CRG98_021209 [Punica granatum]
MAAVMTGRTMEMEISGEIDAPIYPFQHCPKTGFSSFSIFSMSFFLPRLRLGASRKPLNCRFTSSSSKTPKTPSRVYADPNLISSGLACVCYGAAWDCPLSRGNA